MFCACFCSHNASSANLHIGVIRGIRNSDLPHIRGQGLGGLRPGHGTRIADVPLGNGPGDVVGEFTALFHGAFKGFPADGVAGLAGYAVHGTL